MADRPSPGRLAPHRAGDRVQGGEEDRERAIPGRSPPLMRWGRHGLAQFIVLAANQREGRILADVSEEFMRALVIGADMSVALASGAHAVA